MKKLLLVFSVSMLFTVSRAQFYSDGIISNDGGLVSDWQSQWFNATNGIYTGTNNGVFEHRGPSTQTFMNNGSFSALSGHTDKFMGPDGLPGAQEIGGTARPYFFGLELSNGAAEIISITNPDGANVRNMATFNNGITTTMRNLHKDAALRFEAAASYTGGNTDAQHVNGYVSKLGTAAFTFPVGSGTDLRTLTMGAPAAASEVSVAWFAGNPGTTTDPSDNATHSTTALAAPLLSLSTAGFWDYVLVTGNDDALAVTVSIPDLTGFAVASDLRLAGWNGSQWIDLSGSANASGNAENSTLSGTIPAGVSISAIAVASTSFALPVEFASFTVSAAANCEVDVKWSTASELNNSHFVVERSADGISFTALTQVPGAGNSSVLRNYQYVDKAPLPGNNFYRIRQVDLDARSKTTAIRSVRMQCNTGADLRVYPTVTGSLTTVFLNEAFKNAQAELFDMAGRRVPARIQSGGMKITVSVAGISSGQYILRVTKNSSVQTFKIVKP